MEETYQPVSDVGSCNGTEVSSTIGTYVILLWYCTVYTVLCYIVEHKHEAKDTDSVPTGSFVSQSSLPPELQSKDEQDKCEQL